MSESCNCFNEHLEEIKKKVINDFLPGNAIPETLHVDWSNKVFRLDGKTNNVMLKLDCEYQQTKKDDTLYRNKTKHPLSVGMSFCPFCGNKF